MGNWEKMESWKNSKDKSPRKLNVLLCCSGSVATIKIPEIIVRLKDFTNVFFICSSPAVRHFVLRSKEYNNNFHEKFDKLGGEDLEILDEEEWSVWNRLGDPVLHIELRNWADIILVAPASADLIAKISSGQSDSLLLSVLRAWDFSNPSKRCLLCPAMNTVMWTHPVTAESLSTLQKWGFEVIAPVSKLLACKDVGNGALANVNDIVERVKEHCTKLLVQEDNCNENNSTNKDLSWIETYLDGKLNGSVKIRNSSILPTINAICIIGMMLSIGIFQSFAKAE